MRISDWSSDVCSSDLSAEHQILRSAKPFVDDDDHVIAHRGEGDRERDHADAEAHRQPDGEQVERGRRVRQHPDDEVEAQQQEADRQRQQEPRRKGIAAEKGDVAERSEEHTSELQSLMRISYAVFCLKKKKNKTRKQE